MARYDARQIQKRSTVPGAVPTVAPSNNHLDGTWGVNDIYEGELFINIPDQKIFMRCATNIIDITATIAGITTASNGLTLSGSDVKLGGTLTANTAINGAFNFNIGNVTPVTSYNVTSSGTISLTNLSNSQVSLGLNLTLTSVGAKVQIISQTNTEISTGGVLRVNIDGSGGITIPQFAGVGDRTLGVDSTGKLKIVAGGGGGGISLTDLSAANGITYNNSTGQFKLGGLLTENTDINGAFAVRFGLITPLTAFDIFTDNAIILESGTTNTITAGTLLTLNAANGKVSVQTNSAQPIEFVTNNVTRLSIDASGVSTFTGNVEIDTLIGASDRYIGADANGLLKVMPTPQAELVSGTNIKTINGNSLLGSGNLQVGDVLIGGNTVTSTMMIGTNSIHALTLETNSIVRQTIDSDGLVTFNGTSGNAGVVRMRNLQILDFDGETWRNALFSSNNNAILVGTGYGSLFTPANIDNASGSLVIGINTGAIQLSSQAKNDNTGYIRLISGNATTATASIGSSHIYISTGNVTNAGALSSQFSSSIRLDSGTVTGSATRGGVVFFNGNAEPTWNGLQRGIFVGNATAIPTGNPTNGFFQYSNAGVPTFRNTSGNIIKLETRPSVTSVQGIADALTNLGFLASSTITSSGSAVNVLSANLDFVFGSEDGYIVNTITSALITSVNFLSFTAIPLETTETSLDDFSLNGITFNIEDIIDSTSFKIRATATNGASGTYRIKYFITHS